jgi:Uri superfamily endonuclease
MNIDEIALRVAEQIVKLVLAELSKDAEPVAVIRNSHQIDFIGCKDIPARTELFTRPAMPDQSEIEHRRRSENEPM